MQTGALLMEAVTIREHSVSELLELGKHFKQAMEESLAALLVKLTDPEADRISLSIVPVGKKMQLLIPPRDKDFI